MWFWKFWQEKLFKVINPPHKPCVTLFWNIFLLHILILSEFACCWFSFANGSSDLNWQSVDIRRLFEYTLQTHSRTHVPHVWLYKRVIKIKPFPVFSFNCVAINEWFHVSAGCKYACHTACRDRVSLDCHPAASPVSKDQLNNNNTPPHVSTQYHAMCVWEWVHPLFYLLYCMKYEVSFCMTGLLKYRTCKRPKMHKKYTQNWKWPTSG